MTSAIIITICVLLLVAYIFDLTSSYTKIPPVILLLLLGWTIRQLTTWFGVRMPDFSAVLPVLGTVGLILIVLEGSLDLQLTRSKIPLIRKSFFGALIPVAALGGILALAFRYYGNYGLKECILNALPFCVISSAIAIPTAKNLPVISRDFVTYESSFSDILGVLVFNFFAFNTAIDGKAFGFFVGEVMIILVVSFVATIGLSYLLNKIEHHVKFVPIVLLVVLIYAVSKIYHLPGLLFILLFGLSIGNLDELKQFKLIQRFNPDKLNDEVKKFHELTIEATFVIRALFFLLFGYFIETNEVLNADTFLWSAGIIIIIFAIRAVQLKLSRLPMQPLLFVAPRGLITILLFLSIRPWQSIAVVNKSLVIQVVVMSAVIMMIGMVFYRRRDK